MAALADAAALAVDTAFLARVTSAVQRVAVELSILIKEMETVSPADKQRWIFCRAVLADSTTYGAAFAWSVASLEFMDEAADDATIATQVSNLWDVYSNIPLQ